MCSINQWHAILTNTSVRKTIILSSEAYIHWPYKIVLGSQGGKGIWTGPRSPNRSLVSDNDKGCGSPEKNDPKTHLGGCLFNIETGECWGHPSLPRLLSSCVVIQPSHRVDRSNRACRRCGVDGIDVCVRRQGVGRRGSGVALLPDERHAQLHQLYDRRALCSDASQFWWPNLLLWADSFLKAVGLGV